MHGCGGLFVLRKVGLGEGVEGGWSWDGELGVWVVFAIDGLDCREIFRRWKGWSHFERLGGAVWWRWDALVHRMADPPPVFETINDKSH